MSLFEQPLDTQEKISHVIENNKYSSLTNMCNPTDYVVFFNAKKRMMLHA